MVNFHSPSHIYNLVDSVPFMQCNVQSGYFEHACFFIDQRLLDLVQRQPGSV